MSKAELRTKVSRIILRIFISILFPLYFHHLPSCPLTLPDSTGRKICGSNILPSAAVHLGHTYEVHKKGKPYTACSMFKVFYEQLHTNPRRKLDKHVIYFYSHFPDGEKMVEWPSKGRSRSWNWDEIKGLLTTLPTGKKSDCSASLFCIYCTDKSLLPHSHERMYKMDFYDCSGIW